MSYLVDIVKMAVAAATSIVFLALAIYILVLGKWFFVPFVFAAAVIYGVVAVLNGRTVCFEEDGAQLKCFGICQKSFQWSQVMEVGVVGLRVLKSKNSKRTGSKYIYLSPRKMDEDERFRMCLNWAPKDMIYLRYSKKRISALKKHWKKGVVLHNTGDLVLPR